jgi:periplasmic protein TonB
VFERVTGRKKLNERRAFGAMAVSAAVHVFLVFLLIWGTRQGILLADEPFGDGIFDDQAPGGGGGGGEEVTYYEIPPPPPAPAPVQEPEDVVVPPEEVPPPPPPEPEKQPAAETPAPPAPAPPAPAPSAGGGAGTAGGQGAGQGPGTGPGVGPGSGGGTGGGDGGGIGSGTGPGAGRGDGRVRPPVEEFLLLPPEPRPRGVRGRVAVVTVTIDVQGRVTDAEVTQSSGDRGYDARIRRTALEWRFRPARDQDNRPVQVNYPVELQL